MDVKEDEKMIHSIISQVPLGSTLTSREAGMKVAPLSIYTAAACAPLRTRRAKEQPNNMYVHHNTYLLQSLSV